MVATVDAYGLRQSIEFIRGCINKEQVYKIKETSN
jgi:hypothetical protein